MDSCLKEKTAWQPKPLKELFPALSLGTLSIDTPNTNLKPPKMLPRTAEIKTKPLSIAELQDQLLALKTLPSRNPHQQNISKKKKEWNSSVKINKKSHTREQKNNVSVRKVLNFQPKAKASNSRASTTKPDFRAKIPLDIQSKTNERISGVWQLPETPVITNKLKKGDKDNNSYFSNIVKKKITSPKPTSRILIPDTPDICNMSFQSNCDASFCDENSVLYNDTITSFNQDTELSGLLDIKKQSENKINMIKNAIRTLQNLQIAEEESLKYVIKLTNEKRAKMISKIENNKTVVAVEENEVKMEQINSPKSSMLKASVIKTKSPSYVVPKKNLYSKRKTFHKTMTDMSNAQKTPSKKDEAFNIYMQLKENMTFLRTPVVKQRNNIQAVDTPTVTSHNLEMQLDKLYNES